MEHIDCQLQTDFTDYYDRFFGATSNSEKMVLNRYQDAPLSIGSQIQLLKEAGITTPACGPISDLIKHTEEMASELTHLPEWEDLFNIVIFNENQSPLRISIAEARTLDPNRFAMEYIPSSNSEAGIAIRYVQAGNLHTWLVMKSNNDWRAGRGDCSVMTVSSSMKIELPPLAPSVLRHLNDPLFSVDFVFANNSHIGLNYCTAPNLSEMGLENIFTGEEVARALFDRSLLCPPNEVEEEY